MRADPTRIAAQIVTGIGFLGAGAIIRDGLSVRGLTTAATLWVVAAIGMACGAGCYWPAVVGDGADDLRALAAAADRVPHRSSGSSRRRTGSIVELKDGAAGRRRSSRELGDVRHFELTDELDRRVVQLELRATSTRSSSRGSPTSTT